MTKRDSERQLNRAFVISVVLHGAAVFAVGWLPAALGAAPGEFAEIRVFDSQAPVMLSPVELVAWPAEEPIAAITVPQEALAPEPDTAKAPLKPEPRRPIPVEPPQAQASDPPQPLTPEPVKEPPAPEPTETAVVEPPEDPTVMPPTRTTVEPPPDTQPADPSPADVEPQPGDPGGGGGGGGGFIDMGSSSENGDLAIGPSGGTPLGQVPGAGAGSGDGVGPGSGGGVGGGSGGGTGTGEGTGVGEGSGSGTGGGDGDGGAPPGGFVSRTADRRQPEVVSKGALEYPRSAVADGVEGTVKLKVLVTETGGVAEVTVVESSRDRRLDAAAKEFVARWKYLPATQNGRPRRVHTYATVAFELQ